MLLVVIFMSDIVLFSKLDRFSQAAGQIARTALGDDVLVVTGRAGDPLPEAVGALKASVILSFLSPWILPKSLLRRARIALNWHPASRDYPGTGCYNFALYEEATEYGAVCHFMTERVDSGAIVEERRFPVFVSDSVETLKLRTMVTMLSMFHETICRIAGGARPQACELSWSRKPFTRKQLDELGAIDPSMSADEIRRRIRAMTYPGYPGARVEIGGQTFFYPAPAREPLA
jgi:methionyl-tRNA formyltransferase